MQRMVIKGSEWHRGGKDRMGDFSRLLTSGGRRCCIGIHARLCGIPDDHIRSFCQPESMDPRHVVKCYRPWIRTDHESDVAGDAMAINDAFTTTDANKIAALRPIFHEIGVSIVWRPDL